MPQIDSHRHGKVFFTLVFPGSCRKKDEQPRSSLGYSYKLLLCLNCRIIGSAWNKARLLVCGARLSAGLRDSFESDSEEFYQGQLQTLAVPSGHTWGHGEQVTGLISSISSLITLGKGKDFSLFFFFKGSSSFHAEGCWARGCLWLASRKETCLLFNKGLRAHCSAVPPGAHTERQNCALTFQPLELPFISSPQPANGCSYTQVHHKKQS